MDIHNLQGATPEDLAKAHAADLETQQKYGVEYRKYWFDPRCGKAFCLFEAPSAEAAAQVHCEAHGQVAEKIIEIEPDLAEGFLGGGEVNAAGAVLVPGAGADARDSGIRTVLFTDIVDSTLLTQLLGDEMAMEFLHIHDTVVREALAACSGREVKHTGDGIMASFVSSAAAVRCAARIQRVWPSTGRTKRSPAQSSYRRSRWRAHRTPQRYLRNHGATCGAAVFPRGARSDSGVQRRGGLVHGKGFDLSRAGGSSAQRLRASGPDSRGGIRRFNALVR